MGEMQHTNLFPALQPQPDAAKILAGFNDLAKADAAADAAHERHIANLVDDAKREAKPLYLSLAKLIVNSPDQPLEHDVILLAGALRTLVQKRSLAMHGDAFIGAVERLEDVMNIMDLCIDERSL